MREIANKFKNLNRRKSYVGEKLLFTAFQLISSSPDGT